MADGNAGFGHEFLQVHANGANSLDTVMNEEDLPAAFQLSQDGLPDSFGE